MGMSIKWTKHLKDEGQKQKLLGALKVSQVGFQRLQELIAERNREIEATALKTTDFDSPSWAYKQAFRLGQQAALKEIADLIDFTSKE